MQFLVTILKTIFRSQNIIERDAFLNQLAPEGIQAVGKNRVLGRKTTHSTVDLAYQGYSSMMDGFAISVLVSRADAAQAVIEKFLGEIRRSEPKISSTTLRFF